ncbi:hypothetical protein [Vibrio phage vB_VpS_CC6]|nr:hypothetical protein [Vibrio phage vB_VpS_CC6]
MKTVKITNSDLVAIRSKFDRELQKQKDRYAANPDLYGKQTEESLLPRWIDNAYSKAVFKQLEVDGLAHINKESDSFYSFADHAGDCFDPEVNKDIDPAELKRQRKNELARFNRQGVYYHELIVLGETLGSIGGFVGNDFYGSGYDIDFYNTAITHIANVYGGDFIPTLDKIQKAEEYTDLVKEFVYCDYSKTIRTKANHCVLNFDERSRRWIVDIDPGVPSEIAVLVFELFHTSHDFRWCTSESGKADILTKHIRANLK